MSIAVRDEDGKAVSNAKISLWDEQSDIVPPFDSKTDARGEAKIKLPIAYYTVRVVSGALTGEDSVDLDKNYQMNISVAYPRGTLQLMVKDLDSNRSIFPNATNRTLSLSIKITDNVKKALVNTTICTSDPCNLLLIAQRSYKLDFSASNYYDATTNVIDKEIKPAEMTNRTIFMKNTSSPTNLKIRFDSMLDLSNPNAPLRELQPGKIYAIRLSAYFDNSTRKGIYIRLGDELELEGATNSAAPGYLIDYSLSGSPEPSAVTGANYYLPDICNPVSNPTKARWAFIDYSVQGSTSLMLTAKTNAAKRSPDAFKIFYNGYAILSNGTIFSDPAGYKKLEDCNARTQNYALPFIKTGGLNERCNSAPLPECNSLDLYCDAATNICKQEPRVNPAEYCKNEDVLKVFSLKDGGALVIGRDEAQGMSVYNRKGELYKNCPGDETSPQAADCKSILANRSKKEPECDYTVPIDHSLYCSGAVTEVHKCSDGSFRTVVKEGETEVATYFGKNGKQIMQGCPVKPSPENTDCFKLANSCKDVTKISCEKLCEGPQIPLMDYCRDEEVDFVQACEFGSKVVSTKGGLRVADYLNSCGKPLMTDCPVTSSPMNGKCYSYDMDCTEGERLVCDSLCEGSIQEPAEYCKEDAASYVKRGDVYTKVVSVDLDGNEVSAYYDPCGGELMKGCPVTPSSSDGKCFTYDKQTISGEKISCDSLCTGDLVPKEEYCKDGTALSVSTGPIYTKVVTVDSEGNEFAAFYNPCGEEKIKGCPVDPSPADGLCYTLNKDIAGTPYSCTGGDVEQEPDFRECPSVMISKSPAGKITSSCKRLVFKVDSIFPADSIGLTFSTENGGGAQSVEFLDSDSKPVAGCFKADLTKGLIKYDPTESTCPAKYRPFGNAVPGGNFKAKIKVLLAPQPLELPIIVLGESGGAYTPPSGGGSGGSTSGVVGPDPTGNYYIESCTTLDGVPITGGRPPSETDILLTRETRSCVTDARIGGISTWHAGGTYIGPGRVRPYTNYRCYNRKSEMCGTSGGGGGGSGGSYFAPSGLKALDGSMIEYKHEDSTPQSFYGFDSQDYSDLRVAYVVNNRQKKVDADDLSISSGGSNAIGNILRSTQNRGRAKIFAWDSDVDSSISLVAGPSKADVLLYSKDSYTSGSILETIGWDPEYLDDDAADASFDRFEKFLEMVQFTAENSVFRRGGTRPYSDFESNMGKKPVMFSMVMSERAIAIFNEYDGLGISVDYSAIEDQACDARVGLYKVSIASSDGVEWDFNGSEIGITPLEISQSTDEDCDTVVACNLFDSYFGDPTLYGDAESKHCFAQEYPVVPDGAVEYDGEDLDLRMENAKFLGIDPNPEGLLEDYAADKAATYPVFALDNDQADSLIDAFIYYKISNKTGEKIKMLSPYFITNFPKFFEGEVTKCDDADGDHYGVHNTRWCTGGRAIDCNDNDLFINPGESESIGGTCDGIDNNCNGKIDEGDDGTSMGACGLSCGDLNKDGSVDIADLVSMINVLERSGTPPSPKELADINGDGEITANDYQRLTSYLFRGGEKPSGCGNKKVGGAGGGTGGNCTISGVNYIPGALKDNNYATCKICDPDVSLTSWSSQNDGVPCGTSRACQSGVCTAVNSTQNICVDSDGAAPDQGKFVNGKVSDLGITYYDDCNSDNSGVREQMCIGNAATETEIACEYGCVANKCRNPNPADTCTIGGEGYNAQEFRADEFDCHVCDPTRSQTNWSIAPDGTECSEDNYVCIAGNCVPPGETDYCTSPDGQSITEKTFTSNSSDFGRWDTCSGNRVLEYYCDGNAVKSRTIACPAGQACSNGACADSGETFDECTIGGLTYVADYVKDTDSCQVCKPGLNPNEWSNMPVGSLCDYDTGMCDGSGNCDGSPEHTVTGNVVDSYSANRQFGGSYLLQYENDEYLICPKGNFVVSNSQGNGFVCLKTLPEPQYAFRGWAVYNIPNSIGNPIIKVIADEDNWGCTNDICRGQNSYYNVWSASDYSTSTQWMYHEECEILNGRSNVICSISPSGNDVIHYILVGRFLGHNERPDPEIISVSIESS
ncbi:MAG: dockerin type I domain-containing protein [Candidatus Micrarchaeota archaeon]